MIWILVDAAIAISVIIEIYRFFTRDKTVPTIEVIDMSNWTPEPYFSGMRKILLVGIFGIPAFYCITHYLFTKAENNLSLSPLPVQQTITHLKLFSDSVLHGWSVMFFICIVVVIGIILCLYNSGKRATDIWNGLGLKYGTEKRAQMIGTLISENEAEEYEAQMRTAPYLIEILKGICNCHNGGKKQ